MSTGEQQSMSRLTIPTNTDEPLVVSMHAGEALFHIGREWHG